MLASRLVLGTSYLKMPLLEAFFFRSLSTI
jgi:hypothetical protein